MNNTSSPLRFALASLMLSALSLALTLHPTSVTAEAFVTAIEPWSIWTATDEKNTARIDHSDWQKLLDTYVIANKQDNINRFNYAAVTAADRAHLKNYLNGLANTDPRLYARSEQRAYWINLYNALTVDVVLAHYPVSSIRKIKGGLFNTGPWDEVLIDIMGESITLNDIEHRILRPIWRDPRIHYGVNCASLGCPNLAMQAFTAANTEELLDDGARAFINSRRGVDLRGDRLTLSSIYDWYDTDFGASREGLLTHLQIYATPALAGQLAAYTGRIHYDYNWTLNQP